MGSICTRVAKSYLVINILHISDGLSLTVIAMAVIALFFLISAGERYMS